MTLPGDRDPSVSTSLVQPPEGVGAGSHVRRGPIALIVEAGGGGGAAMEARLGADGAIRCERASAIEHAASLASACGATVILLLPAPSGGERFEVLGTLHAHAATAGLPIVVVDEAAAHSGADDRRAAFAAGADDYWASWPDPLEARARLFALSRGVIAERQRDELVRETAQLRTRLADATSKLARGQELDERTGLPTRKRLLEQLDVEWRRARRAGGPLSLVLIEVGKPASTPGPRTSTDEERFVRIAAALRTVLRRGGDLLARYGENQLAAALPEIGPDGAAAVAQAMRHAAVAADPSLRFTTGIVTARPQESVADGPSSLTAEAEASLGRARP
jgi:two-component system chemotaxis family response regulator WspR